jgi:hypothetical protein
MTFGSMTFANMDLCFSNPLISANPLTGPNIQIWHSSSRARDRNTSRVKYLVAPTLRAAYILPGCQTFHTLTLRHLAFPPPPRRLQVMVYLQKVLGQHQLPLPSLPCRRLLSHLNKLLIRLIWQRNLIS